MSVFEIMQKNMIGLWEHSLSTAIFARIIATKKELQSPEEISIAGLLHDIGKVIFIIAFKDEYLKLLESARIKKQYIYEVERDYFGITHAEIGGIIAQKWHFPSKLIEPIMYHHRPQVSEKFKLETAIVHLSNTLAIARGIGYSGEIFVPSVHVYTWELLNFREEEIVEIFKEAEEPLYATGENFLSDE